jgi:hypothetical protein
MGTAASHRWILAALLAAGGGACPSHRSSPGEAAAAPGAVETPRRDTPRARAFRVRRPEDLIGGPSAKGRIGDFRIDNPHLVVILDALGDGQGFATSGGNIVDVGTPRGNDDHLNQVFTFFNKEFPRQAQYDRLEITSDGGKGGPAVIRVSGADSHDPQVKVTTEYELPPDAPTLRITTTLHNTGTRTYRQFALGDAIQWGATQPFVAGAGYDLGSSIPAGCELLIGISDGISYGWTTRRGHLHGPVGGSWIDPNVSTIDLPPGGRGSYERFLLIGRGDAASVTDVAYRLRGTRTGTLGGIVREEPTGNPIGGAEVRIESAKGQILNFAYSGPDGRFSLQLPPGRYRTRASAPGRRGWPAETVRVEAGKRTDLSLRVSRVGRLRFTVREGATLRPAKITLVGEAGTPDPWLGPRYRAQGAANVIFTATGRGEILIPPGRYRVLVSRGIEYDLFERRVEIAPAATTAVDAVLRRVVDTRGWLSGDFHQHAQPSFDSPTTLADRVTANAAEGVELLVSTDHNVLQDYNPTIRSLGLEKEVRAIVGVEATTHSVGHFNAFPLRHDPHHPTGGAPIAEGRKPREIFAALRAGSFDKVIQVNHPRAGDIGYFDLFRVDPVTLESPDPEFDLSFDAMEVLAPRRQSMTAPVLRDWYGLLNRGFQVTATGNSDSHILVGQEVGYPRNFVYVGKDAPDAVTDQDVVDAVKRARRVVVTTGPFVEAWIGEHPVGSFVPGRNERVRVRLRIQAAPWIDVRSLSLVVNGEVAHWDAIPPSARVVRFEGEIPLGLERDSWVVAIARGERPLAPVVPTTHTGEPRTPLGFTNPIWIDYDGDGKFQPPNPVFTGRGP